MCNLKSDVFTICHPEASDHGDLPLQEKLPVSDNAAGKPVKPKNRDLADMAEELKKKAKKGEFYIKVLLSQPHPITLWAHTL